MRGRAAVAGGNASTCEHEDSRAFAVAFGKGAGVFSSSLAWPLDGFAGDDRRWDGMCPLRKIFVRRWAISPSHANSAPIDAGARSPSFSALQACAGLSARFAQGLCKMASLRWVMARKGARYGRIAAYQARKRTEPEPDGAIRRTRHRRCRDRKSVTRTRGRVCRP